MKTPGPSGAGTAAAADPRRFQFRQRTGDARGLKRDQDYPFTLRFTTNVRRAIERATREQHWQNAGRRSARQGWRVAFGAMKPEARHRDLAARLECSVALAERDDVGQLRVSVAEVDNGAELWEHAVLVASLDSEIPFCRDRADCEIGQS
jgi:hypothetical protein